MRKYGKTKSRSSAVKWHNLVICWSPYGIRYIAMYAILVYFWLSILDALAMTNPISMFMFKIVKHTVYINALEFNITFASRNDTHLRLGDFVSRANHGIAIITLYAFNKSNNRVRSFMSVSNANGIWYEAESFFFPLVKSNTSWLFNCIIRR